MHEIFGYKINDNEVESDEEELKNNIMEMYETQAEKGAEVLENLDNHIDLIIEQDKQLTEKDTQIAAASSRISELEQEIKEARLFNPKINFNPRNE